MMGPLHNIEWQRPEWALAIALALLSVIVSLWAHRRRRQRLVSLASAPHLLRWVGPLGTGRTALLLGSAGLVLAAVALLGPVLGHVERSVQRRGVDLVVCLDASRSMLARDERPDRLSRAKREISGLLENLRGDRVALIAFSGEAQRIAPLTEDRLALDQLLGTVNPDHFQVGGTDLGLALEAALELFDGRTGAHEAVVLVTDGEDLEGRAAEVAERAGAAGIRVYVVGVGTREGGKIPTVDPRGREAFARDNEGAEVVTRLEPQTLERLARASGGEFLSTESSPTPLEELYRRRIANMEGRGFEGGVERLPLDRYQWPLGAAVFLLGLSYLVGIRRGERRRGARSKAHGRALPALLILALCFAGAAPTRAAAQSGAEVESSSSGGVAAAAEHADGLPFASGFGAALRAAKLVPDGAAPEAHDDVLAELDRLAEATEYEEAERALALLARAAVHQSRWRGAWQAALGNPDADASTAEAAAAHGQLADRDLARAAVLSGPGPRRHLALWERGAQGVERAEFARGLALTQAALYAASAAQPSGPNAPPLPQGAPAREAVVAALAETIATYRAAREPLLDLVRLTAGAAALAEPSAAPLLEWIARRIAELEEAIRQLPPEPPPPEEPSDEGGEPDPESGESDDSGEPEDGEPQDGEDGEPEAGDSEQGDEQGEEQDREPEGESEDSPEPEESEQTEPAESEAAEDSQEAAEQETEPSAPPVLSKEEARRLLDRLAEIEKQAEELREALARRRRVPVTRDW